MKDPHRKEDSAASWERFVRAVDAAVKSGPKHRQSEVKSSAEKKAPKTKAPEPDKGGD